MKNTNRSFYIMNKEESPFCMSRIEFEENRKKHWDKPYEFYRVFPILNHEHQKELLIFLRDNQDPVAIVKEAARLLEVETKNYK